MSLLQQALEPANLRLAWDAVAENRGMPGTDNLSTGAWRRDWEARLVELARAVRSGSYRPGRLRARDVPKKEPGANTWNSSIAKSAQPSAQRSSGGRWRISNILKSRPGAWPKSSPAKSPALISRSGYDK